MGGHIKWASNKPMKLTSAFRSLTGCIWSGV
jgi:hypothetical protein